MNMTPAEEGDIPAYFLWDDGSEYEVHVGGMRRFHGPLFGLPRGEWKTEWLPSS